MRMPEVLDDATAVRVVKLCEALEHATHHKVFGLVMCHSDGDIYIICRPGMEVTLPRLLAQGRWETIARVAEEWQA